MKDALRYELTKLTQFAHDHKDNIIVYLYSDYFELQRTKESDSKVFFFKDLHSIKRMTKDELHIKMNKSKNDRELVLLSTGYLFEIN